MSQKIESWSEVIEGDYISTKSILYIGSFENNCNTDILQKQFKLFESSWNLVYILENLIKYDIIFYVDNGDFNILKEIRKINKNIPIVVFRDDGVIQTIKYIKYNISYFISQKTTSMEIMTVLQHALKTYDNVKNNICLKKEQEEYLKILDDFIIISRTDLKGKITYVNDVFCEISGYSKEELLGSHHNIVRHPDMPQLSFKKLWTDIKNDEIWTGVVKNLSKNGETYIAKSTILPYYENDVKVGYIGLRYVITEEVTEKSSIKAYLTRTIIDSKMQIKKKDDEISNYLKEIEQLKLASSDDYYTAWQMECKKKEKSNEKIKLLENEIKEQERLYSNRIDDYLLKRRENDKILVEKNNQIKVLEDEKESLNELVDGFKIDINEKLKIIENLQKRNDELEDIIVHSDEQILSLSKM